MKSKTADVKYILILNLVNVRVIRGFRLKFLFLIYVPYIIGNMEVHS